MLLIHAVAARGAARQRIAAMGVALGFARIGLAQGLAAHRIAALPRAPGAAEGAGGSRRAVRPGARRAGRGGADLPPKKLYPNSFTCSNHFELNDGISKLFVID